MASRPLDIEYMPVGKKESESCSMLKSAVSTIPSLSSVFMYIHPFFWLKNHLGLAYLQMIQKWPKDLFEHVNFRISLYWKIDPSTLKLDWPVQVPYGVPDSDGHFNKIMFMYIILHLYYCNALWLKLYGYHLVVCNHQDI